MGKENNLFNEFNPSSIAEWKKQIEKDLKGKSLESLNWVNFEGIEIVPYYTKENALIYTKPAVSKATEDNSWEINQIIQVNNNEETANSTALKALVGGVNSLTFVGDNLNIASLLKNIMIDIIALNFVTESPVTTINDIIKYCSENKIDISNVNISISYDYLSKNEADLTKAINFETNFKNIVINSNKTQYAGANMTLQLAILLAEGNEYLKKLHAVKNIENQFKFNLSIGNNYFFEIAKIRAFRLLWQNVLEAYEIKNTKTSIHCETSTLLWGKTDNENNILRASSAAMSAILGGCDSLSITPYNFNDEDFSNRITKNIQILLKEEAYLDKVIDPAAGSYYIEHLTNTMAANSWAIFQEIEKQGGYLKAIENDFIPNLINESATKLTNEFNEGKITLIGINKYSKNPINTALIKQPKTSNFPFGKITLTES